MKRILVIALTSLTLAAYGQALPNIEIIDGDIPEWYNNSPPENMLWGIGTGKLSSDNASCELAKFNAQGELCRQISFYVVSSWQLPSPSDQKLGEELNLCQQEFSNLVSLMASEQVSFELSEFIKIERRTKTKDGTIWYLASIQRTIANNIKTKIGDYEESYVKSYMERLK
jgi:hypothetical protein